VQIGLLAGLNTNQHFSKSKSLLQQQIKKPIKNLIAM
jgi:hypothetical protein